MTTGEMLDQAWRWLGEATDLDINTTQGRNYLLMFLNQAIKATAMFKDLPARRHWRSRQRKKEKFLKYQMFSGTVQAGSATDLVILDNLPGTFTDLSGMVLEINGELVGIMGNTGTTCIIRPALSSDPSGLSYNIYPRWLQIDSTIKFHEVLKIRDYDNETDLDQAGKDDGFSNSFTTLGSPSSWYRHGRRIYLDQVPETDTYFQVWLFTLPDDVVSDNDVPDIPEVFHPGVIHYTCYLGYLWMLENVEAYAAKQRYIDYMRSIRDEYDVQDEMRIDIPITVEVGE